MNSQDLVIMIKQAALDAVKATQPANVLFGKVISASPLKIFVDQKMTLTKEQLILTSNVTDHTVSVVIDWNTENALGDHQHGISLTTGTSDLHSHSVSGSTGNTNLTHKHSLTGTKTMTIKNALKMNDKVIMLQCAGGQKFIVIDRIGGD